MAIDDYTTLINPFYPLSGPQTCSGLDIEPVFAQSEGGGVFEELGNVTTVGSAGAASAYGTFDQGGNVMEWNDAPVGTNKYVMRGGSLWLDGEFMASTVVSSYLAHLGGSSLGFRLVSLAPIVTQVVPLPAPGALLCLALGGLAVRRYPRHLISTHA